MYDYGSTGTVRKRVNKLVSFFLKEVSMHLSLTHTHARARARTHASTHNHKLICKSISEGFRCCSRVFPIVFVSLFMCP